MRKLLGTALLLIMLLCQTAHADDVLADNILVEKSKRTMKLFHNGKVLKSYHIMLGKRPIGAKHRRGDLKTPEGHYFINGRLENSAYHLALRISYPNDQDLKMAEKQGINAGNRVMIHGLPADFGKRRRKRDWTNGCIAVTNEEIEEIWRLVPDGTPIEIRP